MKSRGVLFTILLMLFGASIVDAECLDGDLVKLRNEAALVKVKTFPDTYETAPGEEYPPEGYMGDPKDYVMKKDVYKIQILNITENLRLELTDTDNKTITNIKYQDTNNGTYIIELKNLSQIHNYSYSVLSDNYEKCYDEALFKGVFLIPKVNLNSSTIYCQNYPTHQMCQKYINFDITTSEFIIEMEKYEKSIKQEEIKIKKEEKKSLLSVLKEFYEKYKNIILISGIVVFVLLVALIIITIIKRRRRVI